MKDKIEKILENHSINEENQAITLTEKYYDAKCSKCLHYWVLNGKETCTNKDVKLYYNKRKKIDSMEVCDNYNL